MAAVTTSQRGMSSVSGQRATATGSGASGSSRTASLSVVATPQAPAAATRRATAARSAGGVPVVVGEGAGVDDLPAIGRERVDELRRLADAGHGHQRTLARGRLALHGHRRAEPASGADATRHAVGVGLGLRLGIGGTDHDQDPGPRQRRDRLAQPALRQHGIARRACRRP